MKKLTAYSLLELIIVIAILSIISIFMLPPLQEIFTFNEAKIAESKILQLIQFAEHEARATGVSIILCPSDKNFNCSNTAENNLVVFLNSSENGKISNSDDILFVEKFSGSLHFQSYPFYRHYLIFKSNRDESDNGTFWYCSKRKASLFSVVLSKYGILKINYPDKSGVLRDSHNKILAC